MRPTHKDARPHQKEIQGRRHLSKVLKEIRAELDPDDETSLQDDIHEDVLGLAAWWVEVYHTLQTQHHVSDRVQQLFWQLVCRPCVNFVYRGRQSQ